MNTAIIPAAASVLIASVDMFGLQGRDPHPTADCEGKTAYVIEFVGTEFGDYDDDDVARIHLYNCLVPGLGIFTFADYELDYTA